MKLKYIILAAIIALVLDKLKELYYLYWFNP